MSKKSSTFARKCVQNVEQEDKFSSIKDKNIMAKGQKGQKKSNSVLSWLRKIFTNTRVIMALTIIGTIGTIVAAVVSIKSCTSDRPSQISLIYYDSFGEDTNVDNINLFVNLRAFGSRYIKYDNRTELSNPIHNGFPTIENITGKSIKDLRIEVVITCGDLIIEKRHISPEFDLLEKDDLKNTIRLRYKTDILPPHTSVPFPFTALTWPSGMEYIDSNESILFCYEISYNGIDKSRNFAVTDYLAYGYKEMGEYRIVDVSNEKIDAF